VLLADGNRGLYHFDVTDPTLPSLAGTLELVAEPEGFDILGSLGLVAVPRSGVVQAFTLDEHGLRSTGVAGGPEAVRDVALLGSGRYVTASRAGVDLFEAFGAGSTAHYPLEDAVRVSAGPDGHVYAAGRTGEFRVLTADDLSEKSRMAADRPSRVVDLVVEQDMAYLILATHVRAIQVGTSPSEIARLEADPHALVRAGAMLDGELYVATSDGLLVLRLVDAGPPIGTAYLPTLSTERSMSR
jgi:hypothetical protein